MRTSTLTDATLESARRTRPPAEGEREITEAGVGVLL